jgi:hypothetical protein
MSTHPKLVRKMLPSTPGLASMFAGRLPAWACGIAEPEHADLPSGIYPELLGKRFLSNSGIVPMTAGHLPV